MSIEIGKSPMSAERYQYVVGGTLAAVSGIFLFGGVPLVAAIIAGVGVVVDGRVFLHRLFRGGTRKLHAGSDMSIF